MSATEAKLPGPDHPITVEPSPSRVVVSVGDRVVADSTHALLMHEASHDPVYYLPLADLRADLLRDSQTTSFCPYKGTAAYYSIQTPDGLVEDAAWYYPEAFPALSEITGHAAFYPDKVQLDVGQSR